MLSWITPARWRRAIPDTDDSSREVPAATVVVEEEEGSDESFHDLDHDMYVDSKYDMPDPFILDDGATTPTISFDDAKLKPSEGDCVEETLADGQSCVAPVQGGVSGEQFGKLIELLAHLKPSVPVHVNPGLENSDSAVRKNLPKIEYSKLHGQPFSYQS